MEDLKFLQNLKQVALQNYQDINSHIAVYILKNLESIQSLSLEALAKETNTSKPSIIRFCNKVGLTGYSQLKYQIKGLVENNLKINDQFNLKKEYIENEQRYKQYLEIKNKSSEIVLNEYLLKKDEIDQLILKIEKANSIYMFGMNLAYNISRNFVQRVRWLNKTIIQERDLNSIESYIDQIDQNDVVIILSLSGNSKYLIDFVKQLENKTYIFGILGEQGKINKHCNSVIKIPHIEDKIWDSYSIRGQCLIQILDYIYMDLTSYLLKKVQSI